MFDDDYTINSNCIVAAVINQRVHKAGYNWQTSPTQNTANNVVVQTTLRLCDEFENRFEKEFTNMYQICGGLEIKADSYMAVLDHLIEGGLNWGRVVAVFTFAGAMSVQCMKHGHSDTVDLIREWTCSFMHSKVETWIHNNNGWKGLVDFYAHGTEKEPERKKGWGSFLTVGAIGAFALGAHLIANRV